MQNGFNGRTDHGFSYQNPKFSPDMQMIPQDPSRHFQTESFDTQRILMTAQGEKETLPLATIFVRPQVYNGVSSKEQALAQGTAFSELARPFTGNIGGMIHD